ncbi:MAG: class I SAM-dependent methyltransferase [Clostridiaceae bacterium]|nr:class I SAM-dependent methyltransferase [Clostridiaceae bacterium]
MRQSKSKEELTQAHYFSEQPSTPSKRKEIEFRIHGQDYLFFTDTEVFSKNAVDFGTELMLKTVISDLLNNKIKTGELLDLGCGYGVVGVVMKRVFPAMSVKMLDINSRAVSLAQENARHNFVGSVQVFSSDGFSGLPEDSRDFTVVLTNPPVRAGKSTVFSFYDGAFERLRDGGWLYVVLQKKQGAPSSMIYLERLFGRCEVIEKDKGYWIMKATKSKKDGVLSL